MGCVCTILPAAARDDYVVTTVVALKPRQHFKQLVFSLTPVNIAVLLKGEGARRTQPILERNGRFFVIQIASKFHRGTGALV